MCDEPTCPLVPLTRQFVVCYLCSAFFLVSFIPSYHAKLELSRQDFTCAVAEHLKEAVCSYVF